MFFCLVLFLYVIFKTKIHFLSKVTQFFLALALCLLLSPQLSAQKTTIENTGDVLLFALPTATLATTFIIGDTKGSWQFTKGLLLTEVMTHGLKAIIVKQRPDGSDENSFPSGHTSTTFHSASFIQRRYGASYGIPAYALATFTAFSRVYGEKHDGWDVIAGAIIGVGSTYLFTTPYQQEHMELTYINANGDHLLGFKFKF